VWTTSRASFPERCFPTGMPHENPGYDVESRDENGELVRTIESPAVTHLRYRVVR